MLPIIGRFKLAGGLRPAIRPLEIGEGGVARYAALDPFLHILSFSTRAMVGPP